MIVYSVAITTLIAGSILVAYLLGKRGLPASLTVRVVFSIAVPIAVFRIGVVWLGIFGLTEFSDWRQVAGYFALVLNCLVEMVVARSLRGQPYAWAMALSGLVAFTSFLYAALLMAGASYVKVRIAHGQKAG